MKKLLEALFEELQRINSPLLELLQPGLDRQSVLDLTGELGLNIPVEVHELFMWRNGIRLDPEQECMAVTLFSMAIFYPLKELVNIYEEGGKSMGEYTIIRQATTGGMGLFQNMIH